VIMNSSRMFSAIVAASMVSAVGCLGTDDDLAQSMEMPRLSAMTGTNGGGTANSLDVLAMLGERSKLLIAMDSGVESSTNPHAVSTAVKATGLLDTEEGREVFTYAVSCALPVGEYVMSSHVDAAGNGVNDIYEGEGVLSTTSKWQYEGLKEQEKEDVLTCLLARLNPHGVQVNIWVSGPSVAVTGASPPSYDFVEAVWLAKIEGDNIVSYHVWPGSNMAAECAFSLTSDLFTRTCDNPTGGCGVVIRDDFASACTGADGIYKCDGQPAIQTMLKQIDVPLMYPGCQSSEDEKDEEGEGE
jgi:hypothetical protein